MAKRRIKTNYLNFQKRIEKISEILCGYSIEDIASVLFVSSIWLSNIACPFQHQLFATIFISQKPDRFQNKRKIKTYRDFVNLLKRIYQLLPSFPMIEDYIPAFDWGEIKYHYKGVDYKIFYGTELDCTYDLLQLYETIYSSIDEELKNISSRSPLDELKSSLILQNEIINSIVKQSSEDELEEVSAGSKQIPPEHFWTEVSKMYANFDPQKLLSKNFLDSYTVNLGNLLVDLSNANKFQEMAFNGKSLPYLFLKWKERYLLFLPRKIPVVLLDTWFNIFQEHKKNIYQHKNNYSLRLNMRVYDYIKQRIRADNLYGLVNAVNKCHEPHEILFSSAFVTKNRLILIYIAELFTDSNEIGKHFDNVVPKLNAAIRMINTHPVSLGLNIEKQVVEFHSDSKTRKLNPLLLVVIPQLTSLPFVFSLPKSFKGEIVFLDQFLGLVDELASAEELVSLFEYKNDLSKKLNSPFLSLLDIYGSFRGSHGVLIEGANIPNWIMLDPHWGSDMRFESLRDFWSLYPSGGFVDHPRSWKPIQESQTRIRLDARGYLGCALYIEISQTKVFLSAMFEDFDYEQALITNLLMECLADSMSRYQNLLEKHSLFNIYAKFQVVFIPSKLLQNQKYNHFSYLRPINVFWKLEHGFPEPKVPAVRIVFNEDALMTAFTKTQDNNVEIDLLLAVTEEIDKLVPDAGINAIIREINDQKGDLPRFKLFHVEKEVSFPDYVRVYKPTIHGRKLARKKVAELAATTGIHPGVYKLADAKEVLNKLRDLVVREIDAIVSECDLISSIPYLIERADALEHSYEYKKNSVNFSLEHEVDYQRDEVYSDAHKEFIQNHKLIRYFIEKFIQLQPIGGKPLTLEMYLFLISLIEILHEIYTASDNVHYEIYPLGITIDDEYLINVNYENNIEEMVDKFGEEQARIILGIIGDERDRVESIRPIEEYLEELNKAFIESLGFQLTNLASVLRVLSLWPSYKEHTKESSVYFADIETVITTCKSNIANIEKKELTKIIDFLTLKSEDVVRILNQEEPSDDIPVWEHRKRFSRYAIRPLIYLNGKFFWGPYSAKRAGIIWANVAVDNSLPVDLSSPVIDNVLINQKRQVDKALEAKAFSITKRYTRPLA